MLFKKHTILLLAGTMLYSLELQAMHTETENDKTKRVPLTATTTTTNTRTTTTTSETTTTTTPIAIAKEDNEKLKVIVDPYERHLATLQALKPTIKQANTTGSANSDDEMTRIRCLWHLGTSASQAAALEILERKALADNSSFNIRINFLKKLGEFQQNSASHVLNLKLWEGILSEGTQVSTSSPIYRFYIKTLDDISKSTLTEEERDFQTLRLRTFYNRLFQKLTESVELTKDNNKLFHNLLAKTNINITLRYKLAYFQKFYLTPRPNKEHLARLAEDTSIAAVDYPDETKNLRRLASKIVFKTASLIPSEVPDSKRKSLEYSYYKQASQLGLSLAKYHLGNLEYTKLRGTEKPDEQSEWYDPAHAYELYVVSAQNDPLAAYKLSEILENGNEEILLEPDPKNAFKWRQKAAEQGHPYAQYELAQDMLSKGNVVEALKFLFLAAEAGYGKAQLALAEKYEKGEGIEKNPIFAFYWYGQAASQGEASAYFPLGYAYEKGIGTEQDYERALYFYNYASQVMPQPTFSAAPSPADDGRADVRLGKMYLKGKGTKQSDLLALQSFGRASEKNNVDGLYYAGHMQFTGKGFNGPQLKTAKVSFEVANKQNHKKSLFQSGVMHQFGLETEQSYVKAKEFYEKADTQKSVEAPYFLGWFYHHGLGVNQDKEKALALWEKAATLKHSKAAYKAGKAYVNAYLETQDEEKAKKAHQYLKQAAEDNHVDALYLLAVLHEEGVGCSKSPIDSMKYYTLAAEAGHPSAQYKLGVFYEGIVEDGHNEKALMWYGRAAEQQHIEARLAMARIYREGHLLPKNLQKAFEYAKGLGNEKGSSVFAEIFAEMKELVKAGHSEALEWFKEQAEQGNTVAQNYMARTLEEGVLLHQNMPQALNFYEKAAKKGERSAQRRLDDLKHIHLLEALNIKPSFSSPELEVKKSKKQQKKPNIQEISKSPEQWFQLGQQYENGEGMEKNYAEAFNCYMKAAEYAPAQYSIGMFYDKGYHVQGDHQKAIEWYKKAGEQNYVDAQLKLGEIYCFGQEGEKNYKEAIQWFWKASTLLDKLEDHKRYSEIMEWYRQAEEKNDPNAQYQIGRFYDKTSIMAEDMDEAMKWYKKAADQGHTEAKKICEIQLVDLGASLVQSRLPTYFRAPKNFRPKGQEKS